MISFTIIKSKQYRGVLFDDGIQISDQELDKSFTNHDLDMNEVREYSNFVTFDQKTIYNFLFGDNGKELPESADFNRDFKKLKVFTNKYFSKEIYVLFKCPSKKLIDHHNRKDLLGTFTEKFSNDFAFTFTLCCNYEIENEIPNDIKNKIIQTFKILFEVPNVDLSNKDLSLLDTLLELQKKRYRQEFCVMKDR